MKLKFILITLIFYTSSLIADDISNVRIEQRTDGTFLVDIWYDILDPVCSSASIGIKASSDNGATWNLICSSLTGDKGYVTSGGTDKHIVWDFYADNPNTSGNQFKIQFMYVLWGTMTGNDGTVYKTVKIGDQWWMGENSRETKYSDGTDIHAQDRSNSADWGNYGNNQIGIYGYLYNHVNVKLYNWYAVDYGMAPPGWHVPTDDDWKELEMFIGMSEAQANAGGSDDWYFRGTDEGNQLKTTSGWYTNGVVSENGTDTWHFSWPPDGYIPSTGIETNYSVDGFFWTNTNMARQVRFSETGIRRLPKDKRLGLSVRLIKD